MRITTEKLAVTVIIDSLKPQQWVVSTLDKIDQNQLIQIEHIILQTPSAEDNTTFAHNRCRLPRVARNLTYGYIDRPLYDTAPREPETIPEQYLKLAQQSADDNESSITSSSKTDLIIHLGNKKKPIPVTPKAAHGTWFVQHEELTAHVEEAVLTRRPLLWIHLWAQNDSNDRLRRIGSHSLPMQSFSISDVLSYTFGSLPDLIASRLNWLANDCDPTVYESEQLAPQLFAPNTYPETYQSPQTSSTSLLFCAVRLLYLQTVQRIRNKLQYEQWQLGFSSHNQHATDIRLDEYQTLEPPKNTIWADPHTINENSQTYVFFEELEIEENLGRIACAVLTDTGFIEQPKTVLDENHHLSYPFVFKHEGEFYMMPETASRRTINLYKATQFPDKWEFVKEIMSDIDAADSTLFRHDGLWWLFINSFSHRSVDERDQLNLFYANDLLTDEWHPHPMNPVVTGVDRARMAGPIYRRNGELFRPSQFGAIRYGYGINVAKIHSLNKTEYKETLLERLTPKDDKAWIGCHTASHCANTIVIDRLKLTRR